MGAEYAGSTSSVNIPTVKGATDNEERCRRTSEAHLDFERIPWTASITNISSSITALLFADVVNFDDPAGEATSPPRLLGAAKGPDGLPLLVSYGCVALSLASRPPGRPVPSTIALNSASSSSSSWLLAVRHWARFSSYLHGCTQREKRIPQIKKTCTEVFYTWFAPRERLHVLESKEGIASRSARSCKTVYLTWRAMRHAQQSRC